MERRDFLIWVGVGLVASSLPVAIAASSETLTNTETAISFDGDDGFQSVGPVADLDNQGFLYTENSTVGPVLVIRNPAETNTLYAVNPTCTHRSCRVNWIPDKNKFVCPCHASRFDPNGEVVNGPASKPLTTYEARIEGNSVLIKGR